MNRAMRSLGLLALALAACGTSEEPVTRTYPFGPFTIDPSQEIIDDCIQISLNNAEELYVNKVELTVGVGFHHSNWFFDPAGDPKTGALATFPGDDGVFKCADRG